MDSVSNLYFGVGSPTAAAKGQMLLRKAGIPSRKIKTDGKEAGCAFALAVAKEDAARARQILKAGLIAVLSVKERP